jgi:hypothetical protein
VLVPFKAWDGLSPAAALAPVALDLLLPLHTRLAHLLQECVIDASVPGAAARALHRVQQPELAPRRRSGPTTQFS